MITYRYVHFEVDGQVMKLSIKTNENPSEKEIMDELVKKLGKYEINGQPRIILIEKEYLVISQKSNPELEFVEDSPNFVKLFLCACFVALSLLFC